MTRRVRLAGVGLGALLLPACIGTRNSSEVPPSQRIMSGYVVMDRSGVQPPGSRYASTATAASPAAALDPSKPIAPQVVRTEVNKIAAPKLPDETLDLSPMPPPVVAVKHEKLATPTPAVAEAENLVIPPPPAEEKVPSPPGPDALPPAPVQEVIEAGHRQDGTAEPIRRPEWPNLGPRETPKPAPEPEAMPRVNALPQSAPSEQGMVLIPQPDPVRQPEANVSLKVEAPAVAEAQRPAASLVATDTMLLQAIRAFQANRPQDAVESLRHLDPVNQELLMSLMPLMVRLAEGAGGSLPPEELAMVVDRLQSASVAVKNKASLRLDRVCFCQGVRKFADIDPYEPGHEFHPGDMVFLYAEMKNFTCEAATVPGAQPGYNATVRGCAIRLATTLELRDDHQNLIWRTDLTKNDYSLTPPQDYYHTYRFCIPERLPPGAYTLWLNLTDKPTGRIVRRSVEMRVGQN